MAEDETSSGIERETSFKDSSDWGLFIFLGGLFGIILNEVFLSGDAGAKVIVYLGFLFMIVSAIFLFKNRSIVTVVLFSVWYLILGAPRDPKAFLPVVLPVILGLFIIDILVGRRQHKGERVGQTIKGALFSGLLLILIFFLDIGALNFLTGSPLYLTIPPIIEGLVALIPWWSFLGLMFMKSSKFKTGMIVLFVLYLIVVIVSVSSFSSSEVVDSLLPSAEEIAARQDVSRFAGLTTFRKCFGNFFDGTFGKCKEQEDLLLKWKTNCKNSEFTDEESLQFKKCMQEQEEQEDNPSQFISGTVDPTLKDPMRATLIFKDKSSTSFISEQVYTAILEIKNPRRNPLQIEAACNFINRKKSGENVSGEFQGSNVFETNNKEFITPISCKPADELIDAYDVEITALLKGVVLASHQEKAFIGSVEKEEKLKDEIKSVIKVANSQSSLDLAQYIFSLGYGADNNPIIVDDENRNLYLSSKIKNAASGKIVTVRDYRIFLDGFITDDTQCFFGKDIYIPLEKNKFREIVLPSCIIEDYPADYKPEDPDIWKHVDIRAEARIDYELSAKRYVPKQEEIGS